MTPEELREKAIEAYNRDVAKQNILTAMESRMTVSYNDGVFIVTPELISFLNAWQNELIYMLDAYDVPIQVDANYLKTLCKQRWQEVMNEFAIEYEEYKKIRNAKQL
ncbi:hypothetical protein EB001_00675 [bacterium]|nr:hypothetical protein [bacterium]